MNEIKFLNTKESTKVEQNWMSKQELAEFCNCSLRVLEQIVAELNCEACFAIQSHIKKGGYHNLETFYDDYLVKLIQAKLLSNQTNLLM